MFLLHNEPEKAIGPLSTALMSNVNFEPDFASLPLLHHRMLAYVQTSQFSAAVQDGNAFLKAWDACSPEQLPPQALRARVGLVLAQAYFTTGEFEVRCKRRENEPVIAELCPSFANSYVVYNVVPADGQGQGRRVAHVDL